LTVDKILIYSQAELADALFVALGNRKAAEWRATMLKSVATVVRGRPATYRTFGPWWWPLKAQLVAAGYLPPTEVDDGMVAAITTGNADRDLIGAVMYHGYNVDNLRNGAVFQVNTVTGDTIDYVLNDPDFEAIISGGG